MVVETFPGKATSENITVDPLGFVKDSVKVGIMVGTQPETKPKQ